MSDRFTLKLANGRKIKIRQNETYLYKVGKILEISFQEQPTVRKEPVHTHVWVDPKNSDASMYMIDYILNHARHYPIKLKAVAFLQFWDIENHQAKEAENNLVEFVIDRKLSKTMSSGVIDWVEEIFEAVYGYQVMNNLFDLSMYLDEF